MRVSAVYKPGFLLNELLVHAKKSNGNIFIEFQAKSLLEIVGGDFFDFMAVNAFHLRPSGLLDGELTSSVFNVSRAVIENYERNLLLDDFTPKLFAALGSALFNEAVRPINEWETMPIYTQHCSLFDYSSVCEVAYSFPFNNKPKIVFFISKAPGTKFPDRLTEEQIEYLFFPFYLGWLHVLGLIGSEELETWLKLLSGMSLARFRVLRSLFEPIPWNIKDRANSLGRTNASIYRHIEGAFEHLLNVQPNLQREDASANRLAELAKAYVFLGFAPGQIKRTLPQKSR